MTEAYVIVISWLDKRIIWNPNKNGGNDGKFTGYLTYEQARLALGQVKKSNWVKYSNGVPDIVKINLSFEIGDINLEETKDNE